MRVTVAICTWNRCELLRHTLEQLTHAVVPTRTTLEVLVVNNNCTDSTDEVIDEFRGRLPIRRVFESKPGLSHARNAALDAGTGDYIIFTDDDVLVGESWLVEFEAASLAFPDAVAIGGIIDPWFPEPPDPDLMEVFSDLKHGFCGIDHGRDPGQLPDGLFVWGANMAYRCAGIGDLRFDPDLGPSPTSTVCADETDFIRRLRGIGGSVAWWPNMRVRHYVLPSRMTLDYLLRFTEGKGAEQVMTSAIEPAPSLFGAPRWLWLVMLRTYVGYVRSAMTNHTAQPPKSCAGPISPLASRRVRTLSWRRDLAFLHGMLLAYRAEHNKRGRPAQQAAEKSRPDGKTADG
jgi:glycosyltransferase involved in cell wall biosynthesis